MSLDDGFVLLYDARPVPAVVTASPVLRAAPSPAPKAGFRLLDRGSRYGVDIDVWEF